MKEINYVKVGDYLYPVIKMGKQEPLGKYGRMKKKYLRENQKGHYFSLLANNHLDIYLHDVDKQANEMHDRLLIQYKEKWKVTEALKEQNQMEWVRMMNLIHGTVEEIVVMELIIR